MRNSILYLACFIGFASCSFFSKKNSDDDQAVARVYDKYLYHSDIKSIIKGRLNPKDSIVLAKSYIDSWIRKQLVLHKAEENVEADEQIEQQIAKYRESLITYTYENQLIRQKLDTNISSQSIIEYYDKNKDNFTLRSSIVKLKFIKVKENIPNQDSVKKWMASEDAQSIANLEEYSRKNALNSYLKDTVWLLAQDITKELPVDPYSNLLKNKGFFELKDGAYTYLVYVKDYQIKESIAPMSYVAADIKKILINKKKVAMIKDIYNKIYKEALENNTFETY